MAPFADVRPLCVVLGMSCVSLSGYWGPWTRAETTFSNEYFKLMLVRGHKHPPLPTLSHRIVMSSRDTTRDTITLSQRIEQKNVNSASLVILPDPLTLPGGEVDDQEDAQGQQVERPQAVRGQDRRAHDAARRPRARGGPRYADRFEESGSRYV